MPRFWVIRFTSDNPPTSGSFLCSAFFNEVIPLLFAPTKDSRLMQQSAVPRLFLVSLFPLWDSVSSGAISPAAACHSVLQCPGGMPEQSLILCAFCTSVKTDRALVNRPIH